MQTTRLTSIGSLVEDRHADTYQYRHLKEPQYEPQQATSNIAHLRPFGDLAGRFAEVIGILVPHPQLEQRT